MARTKTVEPEKVLEDGSHMNEKGRQLMEETPIWRSVLKMAIPSLIMMLIVGGYMFADNVFAINFANDSYAGGKDQVRMGMSAFGPINSFIVAFSLLFGMGISTRVSINLGAKRIKRAKNTLKTGVMIGMGVSLILIPILIFASKPWMASQYDATSAATMSDMGFSYGWIIIMAIPFSFFNQMLGGLFRTEGRMKAMMFPMIGSIVFNLLFDWIFMGPAGMGIEGGAWATFITTLGVTVVYLIIIIRNKKSIIQLKNMFGIHFKAISVIGIMLVGISPFLRNFAQSLTQTVEFNVIKDVSMHVYTHGGQIGEQLNNIFSTDTQAVENLGKFFQSDSFKAAFAAHDSAGMAAAMETFSKTITGGPEAVAHFKLLANYTSMAAAFDKDTLAPILGQISSGGISGAADIVSHLQQPVVETVSANQMTLMLTGVFPIFALFFPTMFSFAQASRPIASYNYGAKNMSRVKQTYWWTILFASISGVVMYFLATFALNYPLMDVLGVSDVKEGFGSGESTAYRATMVLRIMMISMPMFGFAIGAMILTGSTDRVISSIIVSTLRGVVFFFPAIYIFKAIALAAPGNEFLFWWFYPVLAAASVIVSTIIAFTVIKHLDREVKTLDEKLSVIYDRIQNRTWLKRKAK